LKLFQISASFLGSNYNMQVGTSDCSVSQRTISEIHVIDREAALLSLIPLEDCECLSKTDSSPIARHLLAVGNTGVYLEQECMTWETVVTLKFLIFECVIQVRCSSVH
jgi:hypothetical protein